MRIERFADALERAARAARSVVPPASAPGSPPALAQAPTPSPAPAPADPALVGRLDRLQQSLDDLRTDETSFRSLPGFEK